MDARMDAAMLRKLGIKVGHYTDARNLTGATVFLAEKGATIGIDIRGSNTATFDVPAFGPKAACDTAHAVVLSGGSTYGLESCTGVLQYCEEKGIGHRTRAGIVPSVTGAVIYDIAEATARPGKKEGYAAAQSASFRSMEQGNIGVGCGATCGKWFLGRKTKGGFGMAAAALPNDILVAAFAVTNSFGDIVNPLTGRFYADEGGYALSQKKLPNDVRHLISLMDLKKLQGNTTLAVIATNIAMEKNQLMKVAELAHDGIARAVFPAHSMLDGDVVFALSSLSGQRKAFPAWSGTMTDLVGLAAQDAVMQAIKNSVLHAQGIDGYPSFSAK